MKSAISEANEIFADKCNLSGIVRALVSSYVIRSLLYMHTYVLTYRTVPYVIIYELRRHNYFFAHICIFLVISIYYRRAWPRTAILLYAFHDNVNFVPALLYFREDYRYRRFNGLRQSIFFFKVAEEVPPFFSSFVRLFFLFFFFSSFFPSFQRGIAFYARRKRKYVFYNEIAIVFLDYNLLVNVNKKLLTLQQQKRMFAKQRWLHTVS